MARTGGRRPGAGRKPGKVGEAKRALAEMARDHADEALKTLLEVARSGESEAARVSAAVAILDRAFGRPAQTLAHDLADGVVIEARVVTDRDRAMAMALLATKVARSKPGRIGLSG